MLGYIARAFERAEAAAPAVARTAAVEETIAAASLRNAAVEDAAVAAGRSPQPTITLGVGGRASALKRVSTPENTSIPDPSRLLGAQTPRTPMASEGSPEPPALETGSRWKQYEIKHGGQQTTMRTTFKGQDITVRLDKPPTGSRIIDFKDYDWSNQRYQTPFIQERVVEKFQTQISKYQRILPDVHFQFSQTPPPWAIDAIKAVGGTFSVKP